MQGQPPRLPAPADITLADLSALTTEQRIAVYRRLLALPGVVTGPLRERLVAVVASHDIVERLRERAAIEGRDVAIFAFKAWKVRVYGNVVRVAEGHTFWVGFGIDPAKKQYGADPNILETAARRLREHLT